jgi:hypothetical protein
VTSLEVTYRHILERLARQPGTLGVIFRNAQNRIQAKLKRLIVDLIDKENWSAAGVDIKGDPRRRAGGWHGAVDRDEPAATHGIGRHQLAAG